MNHYLRDSRNIEVFLYDSFSPSYVIQLCKNFMVVKVTLLSAPLSSKSPFCITTLVRKHLISPILFGLAKSGKMDVILHNLGNQKICKSQGFR